jgi:hypothetical protein
VVPWATGIGAPTSITWGPDHWLWVTRFNGQVLALRDSDGAGGADTTVVFTSGLVWPLGLAHQGGSVFVSSVGTITKFTDINGDHVADASVVLTDDIPWGKHWTTDIAVGPDGLLYVGVGSETNRGVNSNPWASSVLRFHPTNGFVDKYAGGFRNPYGLAFHTDGSLFGTDNGAGPDSLWNCDEAEDELNWIRPNGNYGFPACIASGSCGDVSAYCTPPPCGAGDCQQFGGCDGSMTAPTLISTRTVPRTASASAGASRVSTATTSSSPSSDSRSRSRTASATSDTRWSGRRLTKTGVIWTAGAPQDS